MYWLRRRRKAGAAAAKKQARASRHAKRAHQREMRRLLLVCSVAIAEHLSDGKGKRERLTIVRAKNSWEGSTLFGYLYKQSADAIDVVYKDKFRMTSKTLHDLSALIEASGCSFVPKPGAVKGRKLKPVSFKLGACLYVLAKGDSTSAAADCASEIFCGAVYRRGVAAAICKGVLHSAEACVHAGHALTGDGASYTVRVRRSPRHSKCGHGLRWEPCPIQDASCGLPQLQGLVLHSGAWMGHFFLFVC